MFSSRTVYRPSSVGPSNPLGKAENNSTNRSPFRNDHLNIMTRSIFLWGFSIQNPLEPFPLASCVKNRPFVKRNRPVSPSLSNCSEDSKNGIKSLLESACRNYFPRPDSIGADVFQKVTNITKKFTGSKWFECWLAIAQLQSKPPHHSFEISNHKIIACFVGQSFHISFWVLHNYIYIS